MTRPTVPIVSLANFHERTAEISQQLSAAAEDVGFFYIKDHGLPEKLIDDIFQAGHSFRGLTTEQKKKFTWIPDRYLGWRSGADLETVTGNQLWEWFSFGRYGTGGYDVRQQKFLGSAWPEELGKEWKELSLEFQAKVHAVALLLLQAFAIALGRDQHYFDEPFDIESEENPSFHAWNYYPEVKGDTKDSPPRLHGHADMDVITLLFQRPGDVGLEIAPGKDVDENPDLREIGNIWNAVPTAKKWTPVDPIEGCITVNIGDGLQYWTDGRYKSTYHRVRAPKGDDRRGSRMSVPYFLNPKLNYEFQGPQKKYPALTGFDLLAKTGNAYEARRNDPKGIWKKQAYENAYDHERGGQEHSGLSAAKANGVDIPHAALGHTNSAGLAGIASN